MVEIFGIVCGSLVLDLSRLNVNCSADALYYTWMLGIDEQVMVVSNIFQWPKEFLQVRLPVRKILLGLSYHLQYVEH
jgi:hypothetical protein